MAKEKPDIKIEDDIPLPADLRMSYEDYPFAKMKKGSSFYIEGPSLKAVRNACRRAMKTAKGTRFVAREENDGVRCWRVD